MCRARRGGRQETDRNRKMECLGCNFIETSPVTLRDGGTVCTNCPAWKLEVEAKSLLARPLVDRKAYLARLEGLLEQEEVAELKSEILAQYRAGKALA